MIFCKCYKLLNYGMAYIMYWNGGRGVNFKLPSSILFLGIIEFNPPTHTQRIKYAFLS